MNITITHTAETGSLLDGTARGDGSAEIIKLAGWRWGRSISCWYLPRSRDRAPRTRDIELTAQRLREAGFTVDVEIDATYRDTATVEAALADRQHDRADALAAKAERKDQAADAAAERAQRAHESLPPMGEPIKVGHHSEGRHRSAIARADATMRSSITADEEARRAHDRAATAAAAGEVRHDPYRVARRITRLEADLARWERRRDGSTRTLAGGAKETTPPAAGAYAERVASEIAHVADQLEYWRGIRAAQIAAGDVVDYAAAGIRRGDQVCYVREWLRVTRVNPKSVTAMGPRGKYVIPFTEIDDHRPAPAAGGES